MTGSHGPPFLTASVKGAAPRGLARQPSRGHIAQNLATESRQGVGAGLRSMIRRAPQDGEPSHATRALRRQSNLATRLTISERRSAAVAGMLDGVCDYARSRAPMLMTTSGRQSMKAPAMEGLSSTALARRRTWRNPVLLCRARAAIALIFSLARTTASMLSRLSMPATLTDPAGLAVSQRFRGASGNGPSPRVVSLWTRAEKPPMKSTPTSCAAGSSARPQRDVVRLACAFADHRCRSDGNPPVSYGNAIFG